MRIKTECNDLKYHKPIFLFFLTEQRKTTTHLSQDKIKKVDSQLEDTNRCHRVMFIAVYHPLLLLTRFIVHKYLGSVMEIWKRCIVLFWSDFGLSFLSYFSFRDLLIRSLHFW